jgi:hypothetical protein
MISAPLEQNGILVMVVIPICLASLPQKGVSSFGLFFYFVFLLHGTQKGRGQVGSRSRGPTNSIVSAFF